MKEEGFMIEIEVKEGLLPWVVGAGTILIGILLLFVTTAYPDDSTRVMLGVYLIIFFMIGGGVLLCMDAKNRKMTVEDANLCYTNSFGKKKNFTLAGIGHCRVALENKGSKEDIRLYDIHGKKLCKLEFNMKNSMLFVQYLLDNQIKVECSEKSDRYLKAIICATSICKEEIPDKVNHVYEEVKALIREWEAQHKMFDVEWKTGITVSSSEDCAIGIEGYLQKDGQFVCDRKNQTVMFYVSLISVTKSWQIGEKIKIRFWGGDALEELSWQLEVLTEQLPKKRYHTEEIVLEHELKEEI